MVGDPEGELAEMLPAVRAYADFRIFGVLPYAGGIRDQDPKMIRDLRLIAGVIAREQQRATTKR